MTYSQNMCDRWLKYVFLCFMLSMISWITAWYPITLKIMWITLSWGNERIFSRKERIVGKKQGGKGIFSRCKCHFYMCVYFIERHEHLAFKFQMSTCSVWSIEGCVLVTCNNVLPASCRQGQEPQYRTKSNTGGVTSCFCLLLIIYSVPLLLRNPLASFV